MANVNDESTLVVFDGYERQELEVLFQDEVVLDIEVPLFYIKSGEEEIQHYVDTVAKPDLDNHATVKKAELDSYADLKKEEISDFSLERQGIIEENLDNYADNTLKPQLNEFVTVAETAAGNAQASAVASSGSAAAALASETAAASSAATAAATVNGFDAHAAGKQADFDDNAAAKTSAFNSNYDAKTASFNANAADKTTAFNNNAANKQAAVDASASAAAASAQEAANSAVAARPLSDKNITNCITAIPQDIKLALVDGVLTLKAGSKLYKANGESVMISEDINASLAGTVTNALAFFRTDIKQFYTIDKPRIFSGATAPENPSSGTTWLDTTAKDVKVYDGIRWVSEVSLSVCSYNSTDGKVTAVTQVFNGMGYIRNSVYALPGVKGLIPNGFNADGSLNSGEFEVSNVLISTNTGSTDKRNIVFNNGWMGHPRQSYYNIGDNHNYRTNDAETGIQMTNTVIAAEVEYVKGEVTRLTPKTAFHAVDYNDYRVELQRCKQIAYDSGRNPGNLSGSYTLVLQDNDERVSLAVADNVTINIDTSRLTFPKDWYTVVFEIYFTNGAKTVNLSYAGGIRWVNGLTPDFTNGRSHLVALTKHRNWGDVGMSDAGSFGG